MGEAFGADAAAGHLLQTVVSYGRGCLETGVDVLLIDEFALFGGEAPDAGETIGLQFQADREGVGVARILFLQLAHFGLNAEDLLHVMADFVGNYVSLGEFTRGGELTLEFLEEAEIQIDFFVFRAIEGARGGVGSSATGWVRIAEEDEFGMPVGVVSLLGKHLFPVILNVPQDEGNEIHFRFLASVEGAVGSGIRGAGHGGAAAASRRTSAAAEKGEEVLVEDQAEDADDDGASDAEVNATESASTSETTASASAIITAIFDVFVGSAGRPLHSLRISLEGVSRKWAKGYDFSSVLRGFMHIVGKLMFLWVGLLVSQGLCQSVDSQDDNVSYVLPVGEPAHSYLGLFGGTNEVGKREVSAHARAVIGLNEQEVQAVLTITSDLAAKSHDLAKRVKPLMFESRMQVTESDAVSAPLQQRIDSLAGEWEQIILDHVSRLKNVLPASIFRQLEEFVGNGGSIYAPFAPPAHAPRRKL